MRHRIVLKVLDCVYNNTEDILGCLNCVDNDTNPNQSDFELKNWK